MSLSDAALFILHATDRVPLQDMKFNSEQERYAFHVAREMLRARVRPVDTPRLEESYLLLDRWSRISVEGRLDA